MMEVEMKTTSWIRTGDRNTQGGGGKSMAVWSKQAQRVKQFGRGGINKMGEYERKHTLTYIYMTGEMFWVHGSEHVGVREDKWEDDVAKSTGGNE